MLPRLTLPPSPRALALIALAFALPGLAGHDLWKSHDAIGLGIVHDMATSGAPLVPRIAGAPWLFDPPLFHWLAAAFGKLLQYFFEFHAAARLASGALVLVSFWLIYVAARDWAADSEDRRSSAAAAFLVLLGSIGLMVHAHEALPELAALAALCGALAVLPHAARRPLEAGALFGAAIGIAALSAIWIAPASLLAAVIVAHLVCPEWRSRKAFVFVSVSLGVSLFIAATWPLALAWRAPDAFSLWRTVAWQPIGDPLLNLRYFLVTGSWFAWPAWPLALWAAWSLRRRWNEPRLLVPGLASLLMFLLAAYWGPAQDVNLIPLLAPLALLAYQGALGLRRGAAGALDWFGVLTFGFFAALVWFGWFAMLTGLPERFANNFSKSAPGFALEFQPLYVAFAALLTAGWVYLVFFTERSPVRSLLRWAAGIVVLWGTFAMLWMPWADYMKSYRSVALQLRSKIPVGANCIAQKSLGVSQAGALDYHGGIRARPFDIVRPNACPLLLVQGNPKHEFDGPGAGWVKLADVGRPGDRGERYRLYQRLGNERQVNTRPPTECPAWAKLVQHAESWRSVHLRELFAAELGKKQARERQFSAEAPGLRYDYSRQRLGAMTLRLLAYLAAERGFAEWREALLAGSKVNSTENRAALHTALRAGDAAPAEVKETLARMKTLTEQIRSKKQFRRVVNLGTGGSDLGPRLLADALGDGRLDVRFAANVDPHDLRRALEGAEPASTLFVVASKTFTTQETMANAAAARQWGGKHFYAVTSNVEAAKSFGAAEILPMWDWVGGRFSVWSAVGFAAACALGWENFESFLAGGNDIDRHFADAPLEKNVPALMALIGVWNTNFLGATTHAVVPYSNALRLLPSFLQQLEMESNGKRVDRAGSILDYATAPIVWGAEGTVSQHSFHQLLHQGTQAVPADFIDIAADKILSANLRAQADALAYGTDDAKLPLHKQYPGNRPSSIFYLEGIDGRNLGRLLALYEHKVFTQGVIWNINSFDQFGVELGKELAKKILTGER